MAVSSGLRWDEAGLAVRLQDPRAEQLRIDGVAGSDAQTGTLIVRSEYDGGVFELGRIALPEPRDRVWSAPAIAWQPDRDRAALGDRLRRIGHEVQEHLVQLRRHAAHLRQVAELRHHLHAVAQLVRGDGERAAHGVVEVDQVHAVAVDAREPLQVQHEVRDRLDAFERIGQQAARVLEAGAAGERGTGAHQRGARGVGTRRVRGSDEVDGLQQRADGLLVLVHEVADHLDVALHEAERRVDLVRHARDHLAERGELRRVHDLRLRRGLRLQLGLRGLELRAHSRVGRRAEEATPEQRAQRHAEQREEDGRYEGHRNHLGDRV